MPSKHRGPGKLHLPLESQRNMALVSLPQAISTKDKMEPGTQKDEDRPRGDGPGTRRGQMGTGHLPGANSLLSLLVP